MGFEDWRVRRSLRDPVRGEFQVTGRYFAHPNGSSFSEMLTGVVTGPGIAATAGEHLDDTEGRCVGHEGLPVCIERDEPSKFVILWDEIPKPDFRAQARQQAQQAADAARTGHPAATGTGADPHLHVFVMGQKPGEPTPAWATDMFADLARQGILPDAAGATGTAGSAAVLIAVADVPAPQQALPGPTASLCDLTLRLHRPDGASYVTQTRLGFRDAQRRAAVAVVGATLPVKVDPTNDTRVVVDTVAYDTQHPQP